MLPSARMLAYPPPAFAAIDEAYEGGDETLRAWAFHVPPRLRRRWQSMRILRNPRGRSPLRLEIEGTTVLELDARIGQGNNASAYLTPAGDVAKVPRSARTARKLLLQAWAEPHVNAAGLCVSPVTAVDPDGLFLVQRWERGPTAADSVRDASAIDEGVSAIVLQAAKRLQALAVERDLWVDLRARDVFIRPDGTLVHVDYGPDVAAGKEFSYAEASHTERPRWRDNRQCVMAFFGF